MRLVELRQIVQSALTVRRARRLHIRPILHAFRPATTTRVHRHAVRFSERPQNMNLRVDTAVRGHGCRNSAASLVNEDWSFRFNA